MRLVLLMLIVAQMLLCVPTEAADDTAMQVEPLQFSSDGLLLSGLYSAPAANAIGLVIIVHGYGSTNVVNGNGYFALRSRLADAGIASFVWDKPGRGNSEGEFDVNQSVASSASEVVAAAAFLRSKKVPGAHKIGLWGISRGGWIAPLALARDSELAFWISVSGVDDKESFGYLLASNWRINGYGQPKIDALLAQWKRGNAIVLGNGSYADFVAATRDYYADPFVHFVSGRDGVLSEAAFDRWRTTWQEQAPSVDPATGLILYVDGFPTLLEELAVPVLALFGEKDTSVDWQAARALYQATIGANAKASLTVRTFAHANHNLHVCETGSFQETMEILKAPRMAPGYYDAMISWLGELLP